VRACRLLQPGTLQEWADYREPGAVKMAFDFYVEDAGGGWSPITPGRVSWRLTISPAAGWAVTGD
jgi:hypothetical protein